MKGIAGDAFIIFFAIIGIAILTIRVWYPLLVRKVNHVKEEIDKAKEDVVESEQQYRKMPTDIADIYSMTPAERARLYRKRAEAAGYHRQCCDNSSPIPK